MSMRSCSSLLLLLIVLFAQCALFEATVQWARGEAKKADRKDDPDNLRAVRFCAALCGLQLVVGCAVDSD